MKKIILLVTTTLITIFSYSQTDSTKYGVVDVTLESGIFFPGSEDYKNTYNSKSVHNWSLGAKFGSSNYKLLTWFKFSQHKLEFDSKDIKDIMNFDSTLLAQRQQISVGLVNPIKIKDNHYIQLKYGLSYNFIKETLNEIEDKNIGLIMSVGYMKRVSPLFTYYVDLNYDYAKTKTGYQFKDWSGLLINFGISFNLEATVIE